MATIGDGIISTCVDGTPGNDELGKTVRKHRVALQMSVRQLARKIDVNFQVISMIELGQRTLVKSDTLLEKLEAALNIDPGELKSIRPKRKLRNIRTTNQLGRFLALRRHTLGLSQREVAARASIALTTLCGFETGRCKPSPRLLKKLEAALDCTAPQS